MSGNAHASRDPFPVEPWRETSDRDHRAYCLEVIRAAIDTAKHKRTTKRPAGEEQ
jgi:hypothetical protein